MNKNEFLPFIKGLYESATRKLRNNVNVTCLK